MERHEILKRKVNKSAIPGLSDDLPNRKESNRNMHVKFGAGRYSAFQQEILEEILHCRWHLRNILSLDHKYEESKYMLLAVL